MKPEEIKDLIVRELNGRDKLPNWHGLSLADCLVEPIKKKYEDSFNEGEYLELWLVLEEHPEDNSGYKIVYDEQEKEFGLVTPGKDSNVFIGHYGTFVETVEGM